MKFIKNLARPLLLDFAGALKKTLTSTTIPAFSREILLDFERPHRKMSAPSTALTRQKAAPMSCVLHSARGRCRPNFASAPRNRTKFASESRVFSRKLNSTIPNAAHVEVGRRASRALRNTHDIGVAFSRVSAAFGAKIF